MPFLGEMAVQGDSKTIQAPQRIAVEAMQNHAPRQVSRKPLCQLDPATLAIFGVVGVINWEDEDFTTRLANESILRPRRIRF